MRKLLLGMLLLAVGMSTAQADIVHGDDVIINDDLVSPGGNLCVGPDCVNGESFGFDTIRLKENNTRIKFQDTSATSSFPTNDWQITANDSSNGGAEKFSIDDIDGGRTPFTIEAGAPTHSLYVDDGGRIGLGTSTPVVEIHSVDGDSPTFRLEQDGSSGFTPQTWDVAGNETNFFIRDATNGSKLPFRIRPDAPSNSIFVDSDGAIGMGTSSPGNEMELFRSSGTALIEVEAGGNAATGDQAGFVFINGTAAGPGIHQWDTRIGGVGNLIFNYSGGPSEFTYTTTGDLNLTGVVNAASSRHIKQDIASVDSTEILNRVVALDIAEWSYIKDPSVRHLGPMAEDFADTFKLGNDPTRLATLDTSGVALAAIQGLHQQLEKKEAEILALERELAELKSIVYKIAADGQTAAVE